MLDAGFTNLATLKARILPAGALDITDWDDALRRIGLGVAARFNSHCNRLFDREEARVDEFNAAQTTIVLRAIPVETIDSVEIRSFTGTLDDYAGGYQLDQRAGLMEFGTTPGTGTERIVVTYDGGFWLDDGGAMPAGATALPYDVEEAFIMQCQAWAEARNLFGTGSLSEEKKPSIFPTQLTEEVAAILAPYRRFGNE